MNILEIEELKKDLEIEIEEEELLRSLDNEKNRIYKNNLSKLKALYTNDYNSEEELENLENDVEEMDDLNNKIKDIVRYLIAKLKLNENKKEDNLQNSAVEIEVKNEISFPKISRAAQMLVDCHNPENNQNKPKNRENSSRCRM